ncbi:MAG: type II secretion system secretin GspD [bacterium]|nr:type II secretion system secretin GspD [bacterium]
MKSYRMKSVLNIFILFVCISAFCAGESSAAEKKLISMDFDNADIKVVIKFISELTGKNIIVDSNVKGNVTVISPRKITIEEAYRVFESILQVNDFASVKSGGIIKIVPKPDASKSLSSASVGTDSKKVPRGDSTVTQIIPLDYASSTQVKAALAPLVSKNGVIIDYAGTNTIIITDIASNLRRLMDIIKEIDLADIREQIEVVRLIYADADELSKQLSTIFPLGGTTAARGKRGGTTTSALKLISYSRTNSIIVVASDDAMARVKNLIAILDVETEIEEGAIHVYYLQNGLAEDMAKVLSNMTKSQGRRQAGAKGADAEMPISGNLGITPDKATNSLVITASPRDFKVIKGVIEQLDIRRRQVYVEATIMEISLDRQRELGVEFRGTADPTVGTDIEVIGGTTFGGIESVSQNPLGLSGAGLIVGAVDGTIAFGKETYLNIGALVKALETESGVNVLSTPHLLTTNNEEAEIIVGENVPFVTGSSQSTGGNTITTIERKDIGIKLKITPQINESDFVRLKIYQEISNVKETPLEGASDLITSKRSASTTIVAKDGQTAAIGGLISDTEFDSASKVPCLGDIPILGILFRSTTKKKEKKNLLIFLTPRIIRDGEELEVITQERRKEMDKLGEDGLALKSQESEGEAKEEAKE